MKNAKAVTDCGKAISSEISDYEDAVKVYEVFAFLKLLEAENETE